METEQNALMLMPEYQKVVADLYDLRVAIEKKSDLGIVEFSSLILFAIGSVAYMDKCPDCEDPEKASAPYRIISDEGQGVRCEYRCLAGHEWFCGWVRQS